MDLGDQLNIFELSTIPFILEKAPYTAAGSDGVYRPRVKPKVLSLFPLKPDFELLKRKNSMKSFSEQATQPISEQKLPTVVAIRGESALESRTFDGSAVLLSSFLSLGCQVPEEIDLRTPFKKPRKEQLLVSSEPPCRELIDSVCRQSSSTPSVDPHDISAAVKAQCVEGVEVFVDLKSISSYQYNEAPTSAVRKSKSTLPSRNSAQIASRSTLGCDPSEHTTAGHRTQRSSAARHGPRPRSSSFRGVTHYKRTGRWEAHIWNKGKQIYLGASSTAEKAARAYDRAAIHFRKMGAELNYRLDDYAGELRRLVDLSEAELVTMLRKQSAGEGSQHPEYPPITEQRHSPSEIRAPKDCTEREKVDQVELVPHKTQLDPEFLHNYVKDDVSCSGFVGKIIQSDQPQGESTLHVPQATHVSKRRGKYIQVIDNMTEGLQNHQA